MSAENANIFFINNRQRLMEKIRGGVIVLTSYAGMQRGNDIASPFEQESNFWWLSGVEMPHWWLIIDASRGRSWLVSPSSDKDGNYEKAKAISGVDDVIGQDAAMHLLRELSKKYSIVRTLGDQPYSQYLDFSLNPALKKMNDILDRIFNTVQDCRRELSQLRAIKQPEEITRIKKALSLVVDSFESIKTDLDSFKHEYEIEAALLYYLRKNGAITHAYNPIVASGLRACDIGYADNNEKLKKRETIIIDIGSRLHGYIASLTRTYSYGEPTQRQVAIHAALEKAHSQIITLLEPHLAVDQYQREVDSIMKAALLELGLLSSSDTDAKYRTYFPHAVSHGVGVDAHDNLGAPHFFQPNMVIAVEPGIYIREEGIGMRLQDTVLITESGRVHLSKRLSTDL